MNLSYSKLSLHEKINCKGCIKDETTRQRFGLSDIKLLDVCKMLWLVTDYKTAVNTFLTKITE